MTTPQFEIGAWVRSIAVGNMPPFVGEVIERHGHYYIIRDHMKRRWWRAVLELETIQ